MHSSPNVAYSSSTRVLDTLDAMLARLIVAAAAAVWIFWFFGEMFGTIGIAVLGLFLAVTYFFVRHHFASAQCFADYLRRCFLYCRPRNARHMHHVHVGATSTAQLTGGHKCVTCTHGALDRNILKLT